MDAGNEAEGAAALLPRPAVAALCRPAQPSEPMLAFQIVYWALTDWQQPRQRSQHLAEQLSRRCPVLYVREMPASQAVGPSGRSLPPVVERLNERLCLLRPRVLSPGRLPVVARLNDRLVIRAIQRQLDPARPVVLWLSHPDQARLIGRFDERLVCFDSLDYHAAFKRGEAQAAMAAAELSLLRRADLVFASSDDLLRRAQAAGAHAWLVPNGVEFERFARAATEPLAAPAELAPLPQPRLLFYGILGSWIDTTLIAGIARARPSWSIILIGRVTGADLRPLANLANVHRLGPRPYPALPAYLQHADVCLLPFVDSELTRAVDPLKLYEYLAAGKPVVATPLPELAKCGDLVDLAPTAAAAVAAIERQRAAPEPAERRLARLAFAAQHTWEARAAAIAAALAAALTA